MAFENMWTLFWEYFCPTPTNVPSPTPIPTETPETQKSSPEHRPLKDRPEFERTLNYFDQCTANLYKTDVTYLVSGEQQLREWTTQRRGSLFRPPELVGIDGVTFATITLEPEHWKELLQFNFVIAVFLDYK